MHVYTLLSPLCQPSKLLDTYVYWASLLLYIHACLHACLENLASLFYTVFLPIASLLHLFSVLAGYSYLYSLLCMSTCKPSLPIYSLL